MFFYDWEQRKLGDEVTFFSGLSYSPDNIVESGSTLVLRSSNVKNGEIVDADNVYVENEAVNSDNVQVGDVIVVVRNGSRNLIGKHAQIKKEMDDTVIGAFMTGVRSDTPYFINALLDTEQFTREIYKNLGATINQITTGAFKKMQFVVPKNKTEQEQIGNFFKQIDDTIALHQRKLDKLKQLKQGYLQQMFPKSGESVPKIRFANFEGVWEQRRLGDLTRIKTGSSDLQDAVEGGKYPFFVRSENIERSNRYIFDGEAILIPGEGRLGEIYHYINGKFDFHQRVYKISGFADSDTDGKYVLYYMQKNFKQHAMKFTVRVTVDSLRLPMLTDFDLVAPKIEEQTQIGIMFQKLDYAITLRQSKLDKLKSIKQSLLQKMFI